MEKEQKTMVLLMLGGIVFMTFMDAAGHYLAGNWYPYEFLLTVKNVLYAVEWTGIGFGLGLLAHGGRMKGIRVSKAYLIGAVMVFLIGACSKKIYGIIPHGVMEWFYAQEISIRIYENWFFAVAGLLLFLGLAVSHETNSKSGGKQEWITCLLFLLFLFPLGQLGYTVLKTPDGVGQQIYVMLYFVRFLLFGIAASLIAGAAKADIPWGSSAVLRWGFSAWPFRWAGFPDKLEPGFFKPEILSGAYCTALMLAAYGGLFRQEVLWND